ncbi:MAG: transposase, partial [Acidobacteriota bacterium]
HVTARSNGRKPHLFRNDRDRRRFLELVGQAVRRYGWLITSWVLMSNHFHLVMETPEPTLSAGMQCVRRREAWHRRSSRSCT